MKILVVNNESSHSQELVVACRHNGRHEVTQVNWHELPNTEIDKHDVIVLSGSSSYSVRTRKKVYEFQKKIIKDAQMPVIGICAGFQLICDAFEIPLQKSPKLISGIFRLTPIANDPIFEIGREYMVYEWHKIYTTSVHYPLVPLATTNGNIAVLKHNNAAIYGLQFHPEVRKYGSNGLLILHEVLAQIAMAKNTT